MSRVSKIIDICFQADRLKVSCDKRFYLSDAWRASKLENVINIAIIPPDEASHHVPVKT